MPSKMPSIKVARIHFDDFSGHEFERLCFAHLYHSEEWKSINWYGQLGDDDGKDIIAVSPGKKNLIVYQCANWAKIQFSKAKKDIDKILSGPSGTPSKFILIVGGLVPGPTKDKVQSYAKSKGIIKSEVWSGPEFEEQVRKKSPILLKRFVEGELFPEAEVLLKDYVKKNKLADSTILNEMSHCFDRPAFTTPFHQESNLPGFKQAIEDTIMAINTGVYKTRNGDLIKNIPSKTSIQSAKTRAVLDQIVKSIVSLRTHFDHFLRSKEIRPCGCKMPDCPTFMISRNAADTMNKIRRELLNSCLKIFPNFKIKPEY